jgi:hypothetical protein
MSLFAPVQEELPLGYCQACGREVLCYLAFGEDAAERLCVHCDARVQVDAAAAGEDSLAERGYAFVEERGGCGSGGCGSGGCSRRAN